MSRPLPEGARERLAARAHRIAVIRRRVVAATLATFVLAWGVIASTGSMGATTTAAAQTASASSSSRGTTSSSDGSTSSSNRSRATSSSTGDSSDAVTTAQS
jgi:cytoskeletal protein RodZ